MPLLLELKGLLCWCYTNAGCVHECTLVISYKYERQPMVHIYAKYTLYYTCQPMHACIYIYYMYTCAPDQFLESAPVYVHMHCEVSGNH